MDDWISSYKEDGWPFGCYAALCGRYFWLCRAVRWNRSLLSVKTPLDALYISSFTLALTDYSPKPGYGQLVVLGQLVSSILLVVALFPLLISRISTFKHP